MASKPYFDASKGNWYVKWKSPRGWKAEKLCRHPGWTKGQRPPKRPPPEAVSLARAWEDRESQARAGRLIEPDRPVVLRTFLDSYILTAEADQSEGSLVILRRVARLFVDWCASQRITTVDGVTPEACRLYLATRAKAKGRKGDGLAYKTLKTERGTLAPAWSQAFQDGRIAVNPWLRAPVPGKPKNERPPFWTADEVQRLVAACNPWLADVVLVGVNTGLRITALLGLEWRDVDFDAGMIAVRAELDKAGRGYRVPMSATARVVLMRRRAARVETVSTALVFPGPRKGKKVPSNRTFAAIGRAVRRSGVTDHGRFNHLTRHTFATHAVMRGVPLKVVSSWLGHSSIAMSEKYAHVIPESSRSYMDGFSIGGSDEE
jgi:integrase